MCAVYRVSDRMKVAGITPNQIVFTSAMEACAEVQIHTYSYTYSYTYELLKTCDTIASLVAYLLRSQLLRSYKHE